MDENSKFDSPVKGDLIVLTHSKRIFLIRSVMSASTLTLNPGTIVLVTESASKYEGFEKIHILTATGPELMLYDPGKVPFYVLK